MCVYTISINICIYIYVNIFHFRDNNTSYLIVISRANHMIYHYRILPAGQGCRQRFFMGPTL